MTVSSTALGSPTPQQRLRRVAKSVVRATSAAYFRLVGVRAEEEFAEGSCLILAPHPDDETFGCGALIARKRASGQRVTVVFVTDGRMSPHLDPLSDEEFIALRQREARQALSELGVDGQDVTFMKFVDGTLESRIEDAVDALQPLLRESRPQHVLVTSVMDRHPDHAALGQAARRLLERSDIDTSLYEYAIWQRVPAVSTTLGLLRDRAAARRAPHRSAVRPRIAPFRPLLVATESYLGAKRKAIAAYPSQMPFLPLGFVEDFLQPFEVFVPVPRS